jgi:hypothetical protein
LHRDGWLRSAGQGAAYHETLDADVSIRCPGGDRVELGFGEADLDLVLPAALDTMPAGGAAARGGDWACNVVNHEPSPLLLSTTVTPEVMARHSPPSPKTDLAP